VHSDRVSSVPKEHVVDALSLTADGEVELFEITPIGGGTVYLKNDNDVTWQGHVYEGVPILFSGYGKSASGSSMSPRLAIGDTETDLNALKPLVFDGWLDGASIRYVRILLANLLANRLIFEEMSFRVKRVEEYHRLSITLQLATSSDALGFTLPHRQYHPPSFPSVAIQ
jgi:phage-related protein